MNLKQLIAKLREVDNGAWDMGMDDFSTSDLRVAGDWALHNDPALMALIEDELNFRYMEG